ncbi:titin-like isoform X4 [Neocloeon triangulifer]|uniref:titin-like isoform X4 n=1 Tax=Neocloeon triangulifer TaxID=2078957 RepID=UPI00286F32D6|nr:titin-like isoform X4 [Neocloeon triangulifer]
MLRFLVYFLFLGATFARTLPTAKEGMDDEVGAEKQPVGLVDVQNPWDLKQKIVKPIRSTEEFGNEIPQNYAYAYSATNNGDGQPIGYVMGIRLFFNDMMPAVPLFGISAAYPVQGVSANDGKPIEVANKEPVQPLNVGNVVKNKVDQAIAEDAKKISKKHESMIKKVPLADHVDPDCDEKCKDEVEKAKKLQPAAQNAIHTGEVKVDTKEKVVEVKPKVPEIHHDVVPPKKVEHQAVKSEVAGADKKEEVKKVEQIHQTVKVEEKPKIAGDKKEEFKKVEPHQGVKVEEKPKASGEKKEPIAAAKNGEKKLEVPEPGKSKLLHGNKESSGKSGKPPSGVAKADAAESSTGATPVTPPSSSVWNSISKFFTSIANIFSSSSSNTKSTVSPNTPSTAAPEAKSAEAVKDKKIEIHAAGVEQGKKSRK